MSLRKSIAGIIHDIWFLFRCQISKWTFNLAIWIGPNGFVFDVVRKIQEIETNIAKLAKEGVNESNN